MARERRWLVNVSSPTSRLMCLAACLTAASCGAGSLEVVQPVGETHTNPSSTGGAQPRGHDEPSLAVGIIIGEEVRRACKMPDAPTEAPRFEVEAARLRPLGDDPLTRVVACIASGSLGGAKVWLIGHADPRGRADYNHRLGLYRATAAKQHLVGLGAPETRMSVESAGAGEARGTDDASWALDRKIEVHLATGVRLPAARQELRSRRR